MACSMCSMHSATVRVKKPPLRIKGLSPHLIPLLVIRQFAAVTGQLCHTGAQGLGTDRNVRYVLSKTRRGLWVFDFQASHADVNDLLVIEVINLNNRQFRPTSCERV